MAQVRREDLELLRHLIDMDDGATLAGFHDEPFLVSTTQDGARLSHVAASAMSTVSVRSINNLKRVGVFDVRSDEDHTLVFDLVPEARDRLAEFTGQRTSVDDSHLLPTNANPYPISGMDPAVAAERPKVFIVHGHDTGKREIVARFVEKLGLEAVVLAEQANRGRSIIEKFEDYGAKVAFAIVLMTPDDTGSQMGKKPQPRARQNVVLELGFFIGRLGRAKVAALVMDGVEQPSDFSSVLHTRWDDSGAWKLELAREMRSAGLPVDLNSA